MSQNHPLELDGIMHSPRCAVWFTPAFRVVRNSCDCGANAIRERAENEKLGRPADTDLDVVQGSADVPPAKI